MKALLFLTQVQNYTDHVLTQPTALKLLSWNITPGSLSAYPQQGCVAGDAPA